MLDQRCRESGAVRVSAPFPRAQSRVRAASLARCRPCSGPMAWRAPGKSTFPDPHARRRAIQCALGDHGGAAIAAGAAGGVRPVRGRRDWGRVALPVALPWSGDPRRDGGHLREAPGAGSFRRHVCPSAAQGRNQTSRKAMAAKRRKRRKKTALENPSRRTMILQYSSTKGRKETDAGLAPRREILNARSELEENRPLRHCLPDSCRAAQICDGRADLRALCGLRVMPEEISPRSGGPTNHTHVPTAAQPQPSCGGQAEDDSKQRPERRSWRGK